jgi:hypothetical protein
VAKKPPPDLQLFDPEGALTREYLLWRGTCCQNGCRNCPYGFKKEVLPTDLEVPSSQSEKGR